MHFRKFFLAIPNPIEFASRANYLIQLLKSTAEYRRLPPEESETIIGLIRYAQNVQTVMKSIQLNSFLFYRLFNQHKSARETFLLNLNDQFKRKVDFAIEAKREEIKVLLKKNKVLQQPYFYMVELKTNIPNQQVLRTWITEVGSLEATTQSFYIFRVARKKEKLRYAMPLDPFHLYYVNIGIRGGEVDEVRPQDLNILTPSGELIGLDGVSEEEAEQMLRPLKPPADELVYDIIISKFGHRLFDGASQERYWDTNLHFLLRDAFKEMIAPTSENEQSLADYLTEMYADPALSRELPHSTRLEDFFHEAASDVLRPENNWLETRETIRQEIVQLGYVITDTAIREIEATTTATGPIQEMIYTLNIIDMFTAVGFPHDLICSFLIQRIRQVFHDQLSPFSLSVIIQNLKRRHVNIFEVDDAELYSRLLGRGLDYFLAEEMNGAFDSLENYIKLNVREARVLQSTVGFKVEYPFISYTIEQLRLFLFDYFDLDYTLDTNLETTITNAILALRPPSNTPTPDDTEDTEVRYIDPKKFYDSLRRYLNPRVIEILDKLGPPRNFCPPRMEEDGSMRPGPCSPPFLNDTRLGEFKWDLKSQRIMHDFSKASVNDRVLHTASYYSQASLKLIMDAPVSHKLLAKKKTVLIKHTFIYQGKDTIQSVHLAGDFNGWLNAKKGKIKDDLQWQMKNSKKGVWKIEISLSAGVYQFKYVIDKGKRWENDPDQKYCLTGDNYQNSVLVLKSTKLKLLKEVKVEKQEDKQFPLANNNSAGFFMKSERLTPLANLQQWLASVEDKGNWEVKRNDKILIIHFVTENNQKLGILLKQFRQYLQQLPEWKKVRSYENKKYEVIIRCEDEAIAQKYEAALSQILIDSQEQQEQEEFCVIN